MAIEQLMASENASASNATRKPRKVSHKKRQNSLQTYIQAKQPRLKAHEHEVWHAIGEVIEIQVQAMLQRGRQSAETSKRRTVMPRDLHLIDLCF